MLLFILFRHESLAWSLIHWFHYKVTHFLTPTRTPTPPPPHTPPLPWWPGIPFLIAGPMLKIQIVNPFWPGADVPLCKQMDLCSSLLLVPFGSFFLQIVVVSWGWGGGGGVYSGITVSMSVSWLCQGGIFWTASFILFILVGGGGGLELNLVLWCIIMSQSLMPKNGVAVFEVLESTYIIKIWLFHLYLQNCWSFHNQT